MLGPPAQLLDPRDDEQESGEHLATSIEGAFAVQRPVAVEAYRVLVGLDQRTTGRQFDRHPTDDRERCLLDVVTRHALFGRAEGWVREYLFQHTGEGRRGESLGRGVVRVARGLNSERRELARIALRSDGLTG